MNGRTWFLQSLLLLPVLAGCVTTGRSLPAYPDADTARMLVKAADIPLVPVPPPPLGRTAEEANAPPPIATAPAVSPPVATPASGGGRGPVVATPTANRSGEGATSATSAAQVTPPERTPPPGAGSTVRQIYETARDRYAGVDSYIVRLVRREVVKDRMQPEELILFKYRKQPWSAHLKWLGKEGQGREVVYVQGRHDDKLHTLLAAGDVPFMPAGKRMSLSPDSVLVRSACRHPITEAGIGANIDRIGRVLEAIERGDRRGGTLQVVGPVARPEFPRPIVGVEHTLPPGADPSMPHGGKRTAYFHPDTGLPMLLIAWDQRGQEVEYYRYDRLQASVRLDDGDFDLERLWARPAAPPAGR